MGSKEKQEAKLHGLSRGDSAERAQEREQKQETSGPLVLRGGQNISFPSSVLALGHVFWSSPSQREHAHTLTHTKCSTLLIFEHNRVVLLLDFKLTEVRDGGLLISVFQWMLGNEGGRKK